MPSLWTLGVCYSNGGPLLPGASVLDLLSSLYSKAGVENEVASPSPASSRPPFPGVEYRCEPLWFLP